MNEYKKIIELIIKGNGTDNSLFMSLSADELEFVKTLLENDYGFFDTVLSFEDFNKIDNLLSLFDSIKRKYVIEQYLYNKIILASGIEDLFEDANKAMSILFSGGIDDFWNMDHLYFEDIPRILDNHACLENRKSRLHMFLDETDKELQSCINFFISARIPVAIFGYSTEERLSTYRTQSGVYIESVHDYQLFMPKEKSVEHERQLTYGKI